MNKIILTLLVGLIVVSCNNETKNETVKESTSFPDEIVRFVPYNANPVFSGTDTTTWDRHIRERGFILKEDSTWYMWYTGYIDSADEKHLGFATSTDGYKWVRFGNRPVYDSGWVEDMCVIKLDSVYYMFAEGRGDTAHLLTSTDRVHWNEQGRLDIRQVNGTPLKPGPFGTPAIWKENDKWYLFYERDDLGIWLATSTDLKIWMNVQDEPVIALGPGAYDKYGVAMNQIVKYKDLYYGYYHATAYEDWREWSTNVAVSKDLIHWTKYDKNPIIGDNKSSAILVNDGKRYRLYSMHDKVSVYLPATDSLP